MSASREPFRGRWLRLDGGLRHALAVLGFLLVALIAMRGVLPAPAALLTYPSFHDGDRALKAISNVDHMNEVGAMLRSAHLWFHAPQRLLEGDCFPVPNAATLGEHMIGEGLFAAVPLALTGEPLLAYNFVLLLWLSIAGIGMYALVLHWTGSSAAGFVAGLIFALQPVRAADPQHLFVHADQWIPLVLLFLHRLLLHGRWRDAGLLAFVASLQILESAYNLLEAGLIVGVCGTAMLVHHRRRLPTLLPQLGAAAGVAGLVAILVLGPFARTRAIWTLPEHGSMPLLLAQFLPGGIVFPGWVALVLAGLGLIDRASRRAVEEDPRLPMLCAGLLCLWAASPGLPLPGGGSVPSWLFTLIRIDVLPMLHGLRGLHLISQGVPLAAAFLAAYGVTTAMRWMPRATPAVVGVATAAVLMQAFVPTLARSTFGIAGTLEMSTVALRPSHALVALSQKLEDGAVLDLPFENPRGMASLLTHVPHYALLRTWHQQRIASCPASLRGPAEIEVGVLGARLPDPTAAAALHALGFRTVIVHEEFLDPRQREIWQEVAALSEQSPSPLRSIARADGHLAFAIEGKTFASAEALGPSCAREPELHIAREETVIPFMIRNRGASTYLHAEPIEPTPVLVRWDQAGVESTSEARLLLPLALAAGEEAVRSVDSHVPAVPGRYEVSLELLDPPGHVLARRTVEVIAKTPEEG